MPEMRRRRKERASAAAARLRRGRQHLTEPLEATTDDHRNG